MELASSVAFSTSASDHFVLVADASAHSLYRSLVEAGALALVDAADDRALTGPDHAALVSAKVGAGSDTIEQILQPSNRQRSVLVLHEGAPGGLARLVDTVEDPAKLADLSGNAAVVAADGSVRVLDVAAKERWGSLPVATEARLGVRQNWGLLGALVAASALFVGVAVRRWARGRSSAG
jgi:hypothetical protein